MKLLTSILAGGVLLASQSNAHAGQPLYFGYYFNSGWTHENADHTNITVIQSVGIDSQPDAIAHLMSELSQAKSRNLKAVVDVHKVLFATAAGDRCPYRANPSVAANWNDFANRLVNEGYLVPNNPAASTVVAFYPVDEPELCGLKDTLSPETEAYDIHPALGEALNNIRNHPATATVPVQVTVHNDYGFILRGLQYFDWVGMDNYGVNDGGYAVTMDLLMSHLDLNRQRIVLVPQAAINGGGLDSSPHTPQVMYDWARNEPAVVMLMPFLWYHPQATGARSIPWLRAEYERIGKEIKNQ